MYFADVCLFVCLFIVGRAVCTKAGPYAHGSTNTEHSPTITMLQSLLLPEGSVAVTRTIVRPTGNLDPDRTTAPVNTLTWSDMSTWSPVPSTAVTLYSTAASLVPGSAFIVPEGWVQVTEGLLVSYIEWKIINGLGFMPFYVHLRQKKHVPMNHKWVHTSISGSVSSP